MHTGRGWGMRALRNFNVGNTGGEEIKGETGERLKRRNRSMGTDGRWGGERRGVGRPETEK